MDNHRVGPGSIKLSQGRHLGTPQARQECAWPCRHPPRMERDHRMVAVRVEKRCLHGRNEMVESWRQQACHNKTQLRRYNS